MTPVDWSKVNVNDTANSDCSNLSRLTARNAKNNGIECTDTRNSYRNVALRTKRKTIRFQVILLTFVLSVRRDKL